MGVFEGHDEHFYASARLVILEALHKQEDDRLGENFLVQALLARGIRKDKFFVRQQLRWMRDHGAVMLHGDDGFMIAEITDQGGQHMQRHATIDGIERPSRR